MASLPTLADVYAGAGTNYLNEDEARVDTGLNLSHLGTLNKRTVSDITNRFAGRGTFYSGGHVRAQDRNAYDADWEAGAMTRQLQNTINTMTRSRILASLGLSV